MERAASGSDVAVGAGSRLVLLTWIAARCGRRRSIKKAGGPIWPTARGLSGRRSCRLRLARDGRRSPAIDGADRRGRASEGRHRSHSEVSSCERARAGDLHTGGQSRRVMRVVSTTTNDGGGSGTDDVAVRQGTRCGGGRRSRRRDPRMVRGVWVRGMRPDPGAGRSCPDPSRPDPGAGHWRPNPSRHDPRASTLAPRTLARRALVPRPWRPTLAPRPLVPRPLRRSLAPAPSCPRTCGPVTTWIRARESGRNACCPATWRVGDKRTRRRRRGDTNPYSPEE
jgi:hypothetical protein